MPEPVQSDFEVVRRQKVYEAVAEQIERLILKKLKPGDKLPSERELAELLQVVAAPFAMRFVAWS